MENTSHSPDNQDIFTLYSDLREVVMELDQCTKNVHRLCTVASSLYTKIKVMEGKINSSSNVNIESNVIASPRNDEIIITGIPNDVVCEPPIILASKILSSVGVLNPEKCIISARVSKKKNNSVHKQTSSVIVNVPNQTHLNSIIQNKANHRTLTSNKVFANTKTQSTININRLVPEPLYKLFLKTSDFARQNKLPVPRIYNNIIKLKIDNAHHAISISNQSELDQLVTSRSSNVRI